MDTDERRSPPSRAYWIGAIWCGIGLFDATQNVVVMRAEGMHHAWLNLFVLLFVSWLPWAVATPLVMGLGRRYPMRAAVTPLVWLRHLAAWLLIGLVAAAWMAGLQRELNPWTPDIPSDPFVELWLDKFYNQLLSSLLLYYCIVLAGYILDSRERTAQERVDAARLGEQLSRAELSALRHQIEPHFLFNALNAVAGLVRAGQNETAVRTIARLSDFLRHLLEDSGRQLIPLAEELRFTQMYLDIQKIRFSDRLQISIDIEEGVGRALVPSLILQPIVENAIKHGIAQRAQGGAIGLRALRTDGRLSLVVCNDGPLLPPEWESRDSAIGLSNVRDRLRGLYGTAATLTVVNHGTSGVSAAILMPLREA